MQVRSNMLDQISSSTFVVLFNYLFIYLFFNFFYNNFYHKLAIGRLEPLTSPLLYFIIISFCMAL